MLQFPTYFTLPNVMTDERIIAYLLKELPEENSEQVEDECFAEELPPDLIRSVEDDLIDDYLRGELIGERRQRFEQYYLTTKDRRRRFEAAATFLRHIDGHNNNAEPEVVRPLTPATWATRCRAFWNSQTWALRAAMAFGVIVIAVGILWLTVRGPRSPQTFIAISLTISDNPRAEGVQAGTVSLPLKADALRISLAIPERAASAAEYQVQLVNDRQETQPLKIAERDGQTLSVVIPAAQLERGLFTLRLFKSDAAGNLQRVNGSYFLKVE